MTDKWYMARIKRGHADMVQAQLARLGVQVYIPMLLVNSASGKAQERPLFSAYIFCQVPPDFIHWRHIQYTRGIRNLVNSDLAPAPLPEGWVETVQARVNALNRRGGLKVNPKMEHVLLRYMDRDFKDFLALLAVSTEVL